ncbi:MAG: Adenylyl cyclase CyaB [archaeon GW2011_AR20]|nr:MAG: Adenylyl cyclase CyaB [archaeon GW2011_AR20]MBS3160935.1 class IV adenylate cyclase [Candidatus Woesearchaeota archaeon]
MREVEILVKVLDSKQKALRLLKKLKFKGAIKILDTYYYDPRRKNLQILNKRYPKEWFRIRNKENKVYIAYKKDYLNKGKWLYSDEYETEVKNTKIIKKIISSLGLKKFFQIDNIKYTYLTKDYEVVLEDVNELGLFLEVEKLNVKDSDNIIKIRKSIDKFIDRLGINVSSELHIGKPEMMLKSKSLNTKQISSMER